MTEMAPATKKARWLALLSYLGLLAWVTLWQFVLVEERVYGTLFIAIVYILPLLLPLRGIIAGKPYTHAWANFIALYYLMHGFTVLYAEPAERWFAVIELLLVVGMFTGCSVYARLRGRELGLGLKKLKEEMQEECDRFSKRS